MDTPERSVTIFARVRPALISNTVELSRRLLPNVYCHVVDGFEDIKLFYFLSGQLDLGHVGRDVIRTISSLDGIESLKVLLGLGVTYRPVQDWQFVRVETFGISKTSSPDVIRDEAVQTANGKGTGEVLHFSTLLNREQILIVSSFDPTNWDLCSEYLHRHPDLTMLDSVTCP